MNIDFHSLISATYSYKNLSEELFVSGLYNLYKYLI